MKKQLSVLTLAVLASLSSVAMAEGSPHTLTGNLSFVSDYQFRGVSQTDEDLAIQGGFDYAHASGFYAGVWGSNIEWAPANLELDIYGGYSGSAGDLGYNVGLLQYVYPDFDDANTTEVYGGVTYKGFGLKASYSLSDYFSANNSDGTVYWDASYTYTFDNQMALGLHYGYTTGKGAQDDYADWKIGLNVPVGKFTVGVAYVGTDGDGKDIYGKYADERLILSVGTTF
jgi:uncharacterized protein (TIGR02001 family)